MARVRNGADALCDALARLGVSHVFGVPGTQSIDLWEALRRREAPRPVVATSELAAAFMANGYARASGRVGVVVTIPGPGFMYALPGLAEALLDSAPVVHVAGAAATRPDGGYGLQAIPQEAVAGALVKRVIAVDSAEDVGTAIAEALTLAAAGEPGPVLVEIAEAALGARARAGGDLGGPAPPGAPAGPDLDAAVERVAAARRPLLFCGQGAAAAAGPAQALAEALPAPVLTTTSGRGVVPETHRLSLPFDSPGAPAAVVNELVEASDAVLVLGAKLSHNGSLGYALRLPAERVIRVDASRDVLARGYPAALALEADTGAFLETLLARLGGRSESTWTDDEVAGWRRRLDAAASSVAEPNLAGREPASVFAALRRAMPDTAVVATDSGLHQYLVRRHLPVLAPRTLLAPANLQAMGFGIPAALGAAVATGGPAVAVVGDGGFAVGGLELATAVQAGLPLVVVVLVDGAFGLIRLQQLRRTGHASGVDLPAIDLRLAAEAVGADWSRLAGEGDDPERVFEAALSSGRTTVVEVAVQSGGELARARRRGLAVSSTRAVLGEGAVGRLADVARRRRS